jgi:uncharacterized protein (TIGR02217 family)
MPTPTSTFIETQFPPDISYGSSGGSGFKTTVFESDSGWEQRNVNWSQQRGRWDAAQAIKTKTDMDTIVEFFMAMQGKAYAFRWKDWADYQIANQQIGVGNSTDGTNGTATFQLVKTYSDPNNLQTFTRIIKKPVSGTITQLLVAGSPVTSPTAYSLDTTTGIFTFTAGHVPTTGQSIVVTYIEFDVPARFDIDELNIRQDFYLVESWEGIKIIEVRQ